jgi:hypothetical protein
MIRTVPFPNFERKHDYDALATPQEMLRFRATRGPLPERGTFDGLG